MNFTKTWIGAVIVLFIILSAGVAFATNDIVLQIEGVEGESTLRDYEGQIDVLSWGWGGFNTGNLHVGGGGGVGRVTIQDLIITKYVDKASVGLFRALCVGEHFAEATIRVIRDGAEPVEYVKIEMSPVIVTSIKNGANGGEDRLTESVTLNFERLVYTYRPINEDGSPGPEQTFSFNIESNLEQ